MNTDEGREAKERVRKKYPRSISIETYPGWAIIESLSTQKFLGLGQTFDEAWIDAARKLR